ncbi:IFNL3 protein, partial [Pitta sordida]|nr:IFNL3 protein [Pitta sordida]
MLCLKLFALLVLVLGVSLGAAFPRHSPRRGCSLFKYKKLPHHDKKAVRKMKDEFEHIRRPARNCHTLPFDREWKPADLSLPDRVLLAEAELNFTITMLQFPSHPSFAEAHQEPLAFLARARKDLQGCVAPSHQPSEKLRHWLHNLQEAMKTETHPCLENYAINHIFEVLGHLKCAACQEEC